MQLSYEARRDEVDAMIQTGAIGCPFSKVARSNDEIRYCKAPRHIDVKRPPHEFIEAITAFAREKAASVLIALPDTDSPVSWEDCDTYAKDLYPETVSSMQFATQNVLDTVFAEYLDDQSDLYELSTMNPVQTRSHIFRNWEHFSSMLTNMPTDSMLLRRKTQAYEQMFPFVMDPSYQPIENRQHPRWSPHFALIINYRADLQGLRLTRPQEHAITKHWQQAVVGHEYVQGYRIPQTPEHPATKDKKQWKPKD